MSRFPFHHLALLAAVLGLLASGLPGCAAEDEPGDAPEGTENDDAGVSDEGGEGPEGSAEGAEGSPTPGVISKSQTGAELGDPNATPEVVAAVNEVNRYRALAGMPLVQIDPIATKASQAHADYGKANMTSKFGLGHDEAPGKPGFTGQMPWDRYEAAGGTTMGRMTSEDIAFEGDPIGAVTIWMHSVFHRFPIISPMTFSVGYGINTEPFAADVMLFSGDPYSQTFQVAYYPVPGQTGVPFDFCNSSEAPQPIPGASLVGYPITVVPNQAGMDFSQVNATLSAGGAAVEVVVKKYGEMEGDAIAIIPVNPLAANTVYEVVVEGLAQSPVGPVDLSKTWQFTTGSASSLPEGIGCF